MPARIPVLGHDSDSLICETPSMCKVLGRCCSQNVSRGGGTSRRASFAWAGYQREARVTTLVTLFPRTCTIVCRLPSGVSATNSTAAAEASSAGSFAPTSSATSEERSTPAAIFFFASPYAAPGAPRVRFPAGASARRCARGRSTVRRSTERRLSLQPSTPLLPLGLLRGALGIASLFHYKPRDRSELCLGIAVDLHLERRLKDVRPLGGIRLERALRTYAMRASRSAAPAFFPFASCRQVSAIKPGPRPSG